MDRSNYTPGTSIYQTIYIDISNYPYRCIEASISRYRAIHIDISNYTPGTSIYQTIYIDTSSYLYRCVELSISMGRTIYIDISNNLYQIIYQVHRHIELSLGLPKGNSVTSSATPNSPDCWARGGINRRSKCTAVYYIIIFFTV